MAELDNHSHSSSFPFMEPRPPIRPPHFVDDSDEPASLTSAQWLLSSLCSFARLAPIWHDLAGQEIGVQVLREADKEAVFTLTGAIKGRVELSIASSLWVRADFYRDGSWFGRGWIERSFEECEIWPDGADGRVGSKVEDDPPGRISKRGYWIQFDTSQWPGYQSAARTIGFRTPDC
jgi:hypothetical protein